MNFFKRIRNQNSPNKVFLALCVFTLVAPVFAQSQSFTFEQCLNFAIENSIGIEKKSDIVEQNRSTLEASIASRHPSLSFSINQRKSYETKYQNSKNTWEREQKSGTSLSLNSQMILFRGGSVGGAIKRDNLLLDASQNNVEAEIDALTLSTLTAYINVLLAKERVQNSEARYETSEKQLEFAQAQLDAGLISKVDFLRIKSDKISDYSVLINQKGNYRMSLVKLAHTMNINPEIEIEISEPNIDSILKDEANTDIDRIIEVYLKTNPIVLSQEKMVESSQLDVSIAKAEYLPTIQLSSSVSTSATNDFYDVAATEQLTNRITPSVSLSFSVPIYQKKEAKSKVVKATISQRNQENSLKELKRDIRQEIELSIVEYEKAAAEFDSNYQLFLAEKENFSLASQMFVQGLNSTIDYIASKNSFAAAENNLTWSKYTLVLKKKMLEYYRRIPITL